MKKIIFFACVALGFTACKKSTVDITPLASVNIVNASVNVAAAKVNFTGPVSPNYYNLITATTAYGANTAYGVLANTTVPVQVIISPDSTKVIANASFNFANGDVYSFYLAGQSTAVDTILRKETIPTYQDSSCGVRFINLSYNSSPISVTLSTAATAPITEFTGLAYKAQSVFKKMDATVANNTYTLQVRDATTLALLGSYTLTVPRFFSCTLAWIGQTGGTGTAAVKVQRVNNY
ncbi:MAG: hypothetical protein V4539_10025 [Bacteroidota bacterium]